MTRAQLRGQIEKTTGVTTESSFINDNINLALKEITKAHSWLEMRAIDESIALAVDDESFDLPEDLARLERIQLLDGSQSGYEIVLRDKSVVLLYYPNVTESSSGRPVMAYRVGNTVYFGPKSNEAYDLLIHYSRQHIVMDGDSDEVEIDGIDSAIIAWSTYWHFRAREKFAESNQWYQTYQADLASAIRTNKFQAALRPQRDTSGIGQTPTSTTPWLDPFMRSNL